MSITLMTEAWRSSQPTGRKLVLLSLCDNANDQGECYPSIARIAERCGMSERAAQGHVAELEKSGILSRQERIGRSTLYTIHPRRICTPAESAPPQNLHPSPAESAPITIIEPSPNPKVKHQGATHRAEIASAIFKVSDVDQNVWQDFVTLRRAKKAPITKTAMDGIRHEAQKAGLTFDAALRMCCERGWSGFKADWLADKAAKRTAATQQGETFRERDARLGRERWEQMTGQTHPDNVARRAANVIDITPQLLELAQ